MASNSIRGRAKTIEPKLYQQTKMSDNKESAADSPPTEAKDTGQTEQFPFFTLQSKSSIQKSKSLTEAEILSGVIVEEARAAIISRLKNESPPLGLEQVRQRRASVKETIREQRKASIDLIRSRTASRASTTVRPNLEDITGSDRG